MIGSDLESLFADAVRRVRERDVAAAQALLERAIAQEPLHAPSLHLLGFLAGRANDQARCMVHLSRAIRAGTPLQAHDSGLLLAAALRRWGHLNKAEAVYRDLLIAAPASGEGWYQLGLLLKAGGRDQEALDTLRNATVFMPDFAAAHCALAATLHDLGRFAEAKYSAERAWQLAPGDPVAASTLAVIRNWQGRYGEAAAICREGLARGEDAGLLNTLGVALKEAGMLEEAGSAFERALHLEPDLVQARYNLALCRKDYGRTDDAIALLRDLVRDAPALAPARIALCMTHLSPLHTDQAELQRRRAEYGDALDELGAFVGEHGASALTDGIGSAQPFYLAYQGQNDVALQRRYGELVCQAMGARYGAADLAPPPRSGERFRLGFVSGHFRNHSVWRLPTQGWVTGIDRRRFELFGYHTSALRDQETDRIAGLFDHFVQGPLPTGDWHSRIARDRLHAIIYPEIGMDPMVARLAAVRLASSQYASWGHPSTTGYPTIDYFLSSDAMEPADGQEHYSERLVRLPGLSTPISTFAKKRRVLETTRHTLTDHAVTYWCGQSLEKYLMRYDDVFPRIAARVPNCKFMFVEFPGKAGLTAPFRSRLACVFRTRGLDVDRYCSFHPPMDPAQFAVAMVKTDIVLDSLGWSGCNSLVEALALGLPVVTMPGTTMRSRHGAALLRTIGLEDEVCTTVEAYVEAAIILAVDPGRRAEISRRIQAGIERFADASSVRALEEHLHTCMCG